MDIPSIEKAVVCRSGVDNKVTGPVNLFGLWNDARGCPEDDKYYEENKIEHFLFQLGYKEMVELIKKLSEAKEKIDEERTEKSVYQKIGDLVAVIQERQPAGPEFTLKVNAVEKSGQDQHTVTLRIPMVKEEYRYFEDCKISNFISRAASFSAAMESIYQLLAQYIRTRDRENHCYK